MISIFGYQLWGYQLWGYQLWGYQLWVRGIAFYFFQRASIVCILP